MFGLLNINKPEGHTSRDAVNQVLRCVRPAKVGHAGTLDPLATGVLVLCLGQATKLIEYVQRMPKRYCATFLLGQSSASDDVELPVEFLTEAPIPSLSDIERHLPQFLGDIQQVPPAYSAIKIKGRKAYDLARQGEAPKLAARSVSIYSIKILRYDYPELVLDIRCGSGTYVRSLGRDLARSLETAAVMSKLERTEIGKFHVSGGIDPNEVTEEQIAESLLPAKFAVTDLPRLDLTESELEEITFGRFIHRDLKIETDLREAPSEIAAYNRADQLVAILKQRKDGQLQPVRNFVAKS